jgi:hypothetical protein
MNFGQYIQGVMDDLAEYVKRDWDGVGLFVGDEGDGKTNFAFLCAYYVDSSFSIKNVAFNAEQFTELVETLPPGSCIVWDEADDLANNWASTMAQTLKRLFKRMRKKNLFVFLVTPTMWDLGKYFVITRARFLFHVYSVGFDRGYVRFFNKKKKRELFLNGHKMWDMYAAKPNFTDAFGKLPKDFPVNMADGMEYDQKKDEAISMANPEQVTPRSLLSKYREECLERLDRLVFRKFGKSWTQKEYGFVFDVTRSTTSHILNERIYEKRGRLGGKSNPITLGRSLKNRLEKNEVLDINSVKPIKE